MMETRKRKVAHNMKIHKQQYLISSLKNTLNLKAEMKRARRKYIEHSEKIKTFIEKNRQFIDGIENTELHNTQEYPTHRWYRWNIEELNLQIRWTEKTNKDGTITITKFSMQKWRRNG